MVPLRLSELLDASCVRWLASRHVAPALLELCELAAKRAWTSDAHRLHGQLLERERQGSTALGEAIAIPHAKVEGLDGVRLALGVAVEGIDAGARDGRPTRLFFLVLSSPSQPSLHIRVLASVSRMARLAGAVERLATSTDAAQLVHELSLLEGGGGTA
jgi:PTS system nitrogen regulatory IIA component